MVAVDVTAIGAMNRPLTSHTVRDVEQYGRIVSPKVIRDCSRTNLSEIIILH